MPLVDMGGGHVSSSPALPTVSHWYHNVASFPIPRRRFIRPEKEFQGDVRRHGVRMLLYLFAPSKQTAAGAVTVKSSPAGALIWYGSRAQPHPPSPARRGRGVRLCRARAKEQRRSGLGARIPPHRGWSAATISAISLVKFRTGKPSADSRQCRALRASRPAYKKRPCGHGKAAASGQYRRRPVLPRPAGERLPELRLF